MNLEYSGSSKGPTISRVTGCCCVANNYSNIYIALLKSWLDGIRGVRGITGGRVAGHVALGGSSDGNDREENEKMSISQPQAGSSVLVVPCQYLHLQLNLAYGLLRSIWYHAFLYVYK